MASRRRHTFGRGRADGRGRFQRRAARRGDPCRVRCGIAHMHDVDVERLAAERHGDGDGLSLPVLRSRRGSGNCRCRHASRGFDPCRAPAEIEPAAGPVGAGQVDHRSPARKLPFDPGADRVDGEIAFDRDLPCGGADRAGHRPERHALPSQGPVAITCERRGPGGVAATMVAPSGRARSSAAAGAVRAKRQEDGRSRGADRWRLHLGWRGGSWGATGPSFHSIVIVFHRFQAQGSVKPLRRRWRG
jgi:hypothetical protein